MCIKCFTKLSYFKLNDEIDYNRNKQVKSQIKRKHE